MYQAGRECDEDDMSILVDYFRDVDALGVELGSKVFLLLHSVIELSAEEPQVLVEVLRCIEREEKADVVARRALRVAEKQAKKGESTVAMEFLPKPKEWKAKVPEHLKLTIASRIDAMFEAAGEEDMAATLSVCDQLLEDLQIIKDNVVPCFPRSYRVLGFFLKEYTLRLDAKLSEIGNMATDLGNAEILDVMKWVAEFKQTLKGLIMARNEAEGGRSGGGGDKDEHKEGGGKEDDGEDEDEDEDEDDDEDEDEDEDEDDEDEGGKGKASSEPSDDQSSGARMSSPKKKKKSKGKGKSKSKNSSFGGHDLTLGDEGDLDWLEDALTPLFSQYITNAKTQMRDWLANLVQMEATSKSDPEVSPEGHYFSLSMKDLMTIVDTQVSHVSDYTRDKLLYDIAMACGATLSDARSQLLSSLQLYWRDFLQDPGFPKVVAYVNNLARLLKLTEDFSDRVYSLLAEPYKSQLDLSEVSGAFYTAAKTASDCLVLCVFNDLASINYWTKDFYADSRGLIDSAINTVDDWLGDLKESVTEIAIRKVYLDCLRRLVAELLEPLLVRVDKSFALPEPQADRTSDEVLAGILTQAAERITEVFSKYMTEKIVKANVQPIMDVGMVIDWVPDEDAERDEVGVLPLLASQLAKEYPDVGFAFFESLINVKTVLDKKQKQAVLDMCRPHFADQKIDENVPVHQRSLFAQYFPAGQAVPVKVTKLEQRRIEAQAAMPKPKTLRERIFGKSKKKQAMDEAAAQEAIASQQAYIPRAEFQEPGVQTMSLDDL